MQKRSAARLREAGLGLRAQRELSGLNGRQLADLSPWPQPMISQWELGKRPIRPEHAALLLGLCKTSMPEAEPILELLEPPTDLYWVRPYFGKLQNPLKSLIIQENQATSIADYESMFIPGLLQTEPYARTLFTIGRKIPTQDRLQLLVETRMDRQHLLDRRNPPRCNFFIHERALHCPIIEPAVMHEQLRYLVIMQNLPHCTIRVVPESVPMFHTIEAGFRTMEFDDWPTVAHTETHVAALFIEDPPAVDAYYELIAQLDRAAMDERTSGELLIRLADEYDRVK